MTLPIFLVCITTGVGMVLSKKQMTEEDIKLQFITPAILAKSLALRARQSG